MKRRTLSRRLYSLLLQGFLVFLAVSGLITAYSVSRFRRAALEERLLLARTIAHYLDATTSAVIQELGRLAAELPAADESAVGRLRAYRFHSPFREAIYLLGERGEVLAADPASAKPLPARWLSERELFTPLFYKSGEADRPSLAVVQPFRKQGRKYYLVSELNPLGSALSTFLQSLAAEPDLHVAVVDVNGVVIAAPDQKQLFRTMADPGLIGERIAAHRPFVEERGRCFICDPKEAAEGFLTVMVPLRFAPWGVVVQQHEKKAFAALFLSQRGFLAAGCLFVLMGVFLSRALLRSVISPIQKLSEQAEWLRRGDLSRPIRVAGDEEIEVLASTLDGARERLAATLADLRALNENLEAQVAARTAVLQAQCENLRLLHDVSLAAAGEKDMERLIPQVLCRLRRHYSFAAVGLVATPPGAPARPHVCPEASSLPWLHAEAQPPEGWERRELLYQGERQGVLFHPSVGEGEAEVMSALQRQLAMLLHGGYLLERVLHHDRQRQVLLRRLLDAGEEERRRIARELHDEISQLLTVVQLSLREAGLDTPAMAKAQELLERTQREVHRIVRDLRPSLLDDLGLPAAIRWYADNYLVQKGFRVSLQVDEDLSLPPEVQIATFRIYQEIVTNILRHSRAENVSIELYEDGGRLVLAVEDDGVGFSLEEKSEGTGLVGMRERAELVGGSIRFDSAPGTGTQVVLEVPVPP